MMRIACALILAGCFAAPQQQLPVTNPSGLATASVDEPQIICRSETPTGSLISREVCREKANPLDAFNQPTIQRMLELPRSNNRGMR